MRRTLIAGMLVAAVASVVIGVAASASGQPNLAAGRAAPTSAPAAAVPARGSAMTADLVAARLATAKYATNLARAKADGYHILTKMIPNMGYHFINPKISGFNVRKPPILVYEHTAGGWQLAALEWVFPSMPARAPLPGAKYGAFGAACHYDDGTVVFADSQSKCAATAPGSGAKFNFWHPRLITLHFWVWYPNYTGVYTGTNPMVAAFNHN
ncbi:MAG: hypothetical protein ACXVRW_16120 [Solirubrobacteraceae bacterium]